MISAAVALAGAATGAGVGCVLAALTPATPDLKAALANLSAERVTATGRPLRSGVLERLNRPGSARDLELLGESPDRFVLRKVLFGALGLAFPPVLSALMAVIGLALPLVIPGLASVALGAALFFAPDLDVRRRAVAAREEMRRAVCVYLELVALERVADAGTAEALQRAADVGDGLAFALIRDALVRAQLAGQPAWQGLAKLGERVQLPELADVADIMRVSGEDGAAVYTTLRARAASLRTAVLTATAAEANAASEHMIMPVALLGIAFMELLGYPAFARILFS
ncbi:MAG: integral rane protein [Acidimicrobiaceae bacterium]|nr:integral rane protein [Acidimicrobiaceae bacterium]